MRTRLATVLSVVVVMSMLLVSCAAPTVAPPQEPQVVKETQIVVQTAVVEKIVEQVVTATPPPPPPETTGPKLGGTLNIIIAEEVKGLYNQADTGTEGEYPVNQITDGLVNGDIDRNIVPGLAERWEISPDGMVYTFYLRKGVKFHDGTEFNAQDVKWTMDQGIKPDSYSAAKYSPYIEGTDIIDDFTVKIRLKQPYYDFLSILAFEEDLDILSQEAVEKWGPDYGYKAAIGTGPFKLESWTRGQEMDLVRNDDYWGKSEGYPYLDKIVYRAVTEDSVKLIQLATKNSDVIFNVPFNNVKALEIDPDIVVDSVPGGTIHYLAMVSDKPPFDDIRVRQAISYGIDREAVVDAIFAGQATVANGIFPPILFVSKNDQVVYPYDPEKAKTLLAEAGYGPDNPLKFLLLTSNASLYQDEAVLVQAQLKEIGVQVEIQALEKAALSTYTSATAPDAQEKRQAFLYRYGYAGSYINDYTYRSFYSKGSLNNFAYNKAGGFQNPAVDSLILETIALTDKDKILENNQKINDGILADAPWAFIAFQNNIIAMQSYVKGLKNWPLPTMPMKQVWLDK